MSLGGAWLSQFLALQAKVKALVALGYLDIPAAIVSWLTTASWLTTSDHVVVDSVYAAYATNASLTVVIPPDDTIPLIGEGTEILSVSITPKTTTNKLRCRFTGWGSAAAAISWSAAMYQGSTCIDALYVTSSAANFGHAIVLETEYTPGATSAQTISVRVGPSVAGTVRMNGSTAARLYAGASNCSLIVEEIKA